MNGLSDRATNHIRKVLIVATLGFLFSSVAATFTFAQESSDPVAGGAVDLPKKEQTPVYRKANPAAAFSLRNNLAWDATGTLNLSFELPLGTHASIGAAIGLKTWDRFFFWDSFSYIDNPENNSKWRHLSIVPEFRYYLSEASRGHYFGADLMYILYNVGDLRLPWGLYPVIADQRIQGNLFGGGLFYGYAFPLGNHWRIETMLGVSGGWYSDIAYECVTCGLEIGPRSGWTLLPNVGVNIVYTFTKKVKE